MLEFSCASFVLESISWMIRLHIIWMHWTEYLNQTTFLHSRMSSGQGWKPQASLKHISPLRAYASSKSYSFELHFHLIELFSEIHWSFFYVHMTVHHNKFLYNKINQMHQFPKFPPAWNSTCFRQFLCPSSGVYSLYTRHWYMSYKFEDSLVRLSSILVLLESWTCYFPRYRRGETLNRQTIVLWNLSTNLPDSTIS